MRGMVSLGSHMAVFEGLPGPDSADLVPAGRHESPQLHFLFFNPASYTMDHSFDPISTKGWRGPYLHNGRGAYPGVQTPAIAAANGFDATYGEVGDSTVLDGWGNPIVIEGTTFANAYLVSAGPDGILSTTEDNISLALQ
jgi:hypothetical protein